MEKSKVYQACAKVVKNYGNRIDNYFNSFSKIDTQEIEMLQMNGLSVFNGTFSYENLIEKLNECKPYQLTESETKQFNADYGKKLLTLNMLFNLKHDIVEYYNFLQLNNVPIIEHDFSISIAKFTYEFTYQYTINLHYPESIDFSDYLSLNNATDKISANDYREKCFKKESQLIENIRKGFELFCKQYIMNIIGFSSNECLNENGDIKNINIGDADYIVIKKVCSDITDSYFVQTTEL